MSTSLHTHLTVPYLNRTGTRLNVKTITNQQLVLNVILSLVKTVRQTLSGRKVKGETVDPARLVTSHNTGTLSVYHLSGRTP